jgi:hypothetical protein
MPRRNPPAKWVLPATVNPVNRRCIKISVPDDPAHIAAFRGALLALASAYNWGDDLAHTARSVALVWRDILDNSLNWGCDGVQTIIQFDDLCGLKWSYNGGDTWTTISLAACADAEIVSRIRFRVTDGVLQVSLNDGSSWTSVYDAPALADAEILSQIQFGVQGTALQVSLNGGTEWGTIYDAAPIADAEILSKIVFGAQGTSLRVSLNGGTEWGTIYDAAPIADAEILNKIDFGTQGTALTVSLNGGTEWGTIYDAAPIADAEILDKIDFQQRENDLFVSLNGGTEWGLIYSLGAQEGPQNRPPDGECATYHVVLNARDMWVCPAPIYDGDTVRVTNVSGAWSDNGGMNWWCGDGRTMAFGECGANQQHQQNDPLQTAYHMAVIGKLGDNYFDPLTGNYTIPSGTGQALFLIQANDGSLSDNTGSMSFDVTLCNGGELTWITLTSVHTYYIQNLGTLSKTSVTVGDTFTFTLAYQPAQYRYDGRWESNLTATFKIIDIEDCNSGGGWQWVRPDTGGGACPPLNAQSSCQGYASNAQAATIITFQVLSIP